MTTRLEGRTALVTGGGQGIGAAIARKLASEGARVIVADLSGKESQVAAEIGGGAVGYSLDVDDDDAIDALETYLRDEIGGIDILANNVGINGPAVRSHEYPIEDFDRVIRINVRQAFRVQQVALRLMLAKGGGSIVNTASIGGLFATPTAAAYITSKGAIVMMTKTAALEYAGDNIRVNAIGPGVTRTPWLDKLDPELLEGLAAQVPQGRVGEPEEMANVAAFLASDEASHVTGQVWVIDGGRSAG
ncbi:SDR family NAD(P)-dependent oxidoreductase [Sanguibacter sp. A247]|uniref:SDR family NAD(P)-dependent oxidoreductase n=1 Tax=unclassified Sanguibacter TaxID=2645534 RepID=UPI003FD8B116